MSNILRGIINEAHYPEDPDEWEAMYGAKRKPMRQDPDDVQEPEDPWKDTYRRQDQAQEKYKKEVDVEYINKEGVAPNGQRYNSAFIVKSKTASQGDNEIYKFNDQHWGAKKIVDTVQKSPTQVGEPYTTIVYYVDNHKHGYWKPWKDQESVSKSTQFESELMSEGISQEELADVLFNRLEMRYPDIVTQYGHEVVGDAIMDVAGFHAGAEELGSSDISIMIREIIKKLDNYAQDEEQLDELKCWPGYTRVRGVPAGALGSCKKKTNEEVSEEKCPHCGGPMFSEMIMNEKKDACYYKVKSRYKVWPSAYASGALVKCRKKGASNWGNSTKNESSILEGLEQVDENLHQWFKEKWVRFGPDGKIRGDCARGDDSEGKPKCLPQSKAHSLGKKGRASAAARKRREDPNPERSGKAINVNTKKKSNEGVAEGLEHTFAGKDPMSFKSPKGGTPIMLIVTAQGSRYLITSDGMVLRNKSFHANTGGEDQGLKSWSGVIEFYDPAEQPGGVSFPLTVAKAVEKRLPVSLSKTADGKRALLIHDGSQWRIAKISDVYKHVASQDAPIVATYSKTPKLNWNVLDYTLGPNNVLKSVHPGSPVTHGIRLGQKQGVAEGIANNRISFKIQKGKSKFATTMNLNNEPIGTYQYDANTGRSIAEIYPEFKGRGLGKLLVLHAIYTAAKLGLDFQEDDSRTAEYDNVLDSLSGNGYIVDDDGYWYVTGEGEKYLNDALNQGLTEVQLDEKWSQKYKDSINCSNPKGFSQRAHCQGKNK